jgi:hypothetical protein
VLKVHGQQDRCDEMCTGKATKFLTLTGQSLLGIAGGYVLAIAVFMGAYVVDQLSQDTIDSTTIAMAGYCGYAIGASAMVWAVGRGLRQRRSIWVALLGVIPG